MMLLRSLSSKLKLPRNKELTEARRIQALEKERLLQQQAVNDRDQFQKIIEAQKELRDLELRAEMDRAAKVGLSYGSSRSMLKSLGSRWP